MTEIETVPTLIELAERLDREGQRDEGLLALDRATVLAGDDPALLFDVAGSLAVLGAEDAALALYDRIADWRPRRVRLGRAMAQEHRGDHEAARADLDAALALPPDEDAGDAEATTRATAELYLRRARVHQARRDWPAAGADAQAAVDLVPGAWPAGEAWAVLGRVAQEGGDLVAARAAHERALTLDPDLLPPWLGLASTYTAQKDWTQALAVVRRGQERFPQDLSLTLSAAFIRGEQGDLDGAMEEWTRLIDITPENATARAMRGALALQMGRPRTAEADIAEALRRDPHNVVALQARISLGMRSNNVRSVLADVDRILEVEPHDTDMLLLRAGIHLENGNLIAAVTDYNRILAIAPNNASALSGIGNAQMVAGKPAEALKSYEAALKAAPNSGAALYNLACAQSMLGRCPQAVELLRRAVTADPRLAAEAPTDRYLAGCRQHPNFAQALRTSGARPAPKPAPGGKPGKRGR